MVPWIGWADCVFETVCGNIKGMMVFLLGSDKTYRYSINIIATNIPIGPKKKSSMSKVITVSLAGNNVEMTVTRLL